MGSRPVEFTIDEVVSNLEELLFLSKFLQNKKELKKERGILKEMIKDMKNNNYEKYISEEGYVDEGD